MTKMGEIFCNRNYNEIITPVVGYLITYSFYTAQTLITFLTGYLCSSHI